MSNDYVWMVDYLNDSQTTVGLITDLRENDLSRSVEFGAAAGKGYPWPEDGFPKIMWAADVWSDKRLAKERDVITGPHVPLVSAAVVEALSGIDIGPSKFVPTDVFFSDRERRTDKCYFQFHITPRLKAIVLEQSLNLQRYSGSSFYQAYDAKADDVAVSREAMGTLTMWMADEFSGRHFFSDKVVQALKKAKLARPFRLTRCRLV